MKYFDCSRKPQTPIGKKFGCLTVNSEPYYTQPKQPKNHRRQFVDCLCDCGQIKEYIPCRNLQHNSFFKYCSRKCPIYLDSLPKEVPNDSKLCKINEQYNYLTIIEEATYQIIKGDCNRTKCVKVKCECGKEKIYREDLVYYGKYISCGCKWGTRGLDRDWSTIYQKYKLSKDEYLSLLKKQNNKCAICGSTNTKNKMTNWLYIDHCHKTGKIRGLLCNGCNKGLGDFEENIDSLKQAILYLSS